MMEIMQISSAAVQIPEEEISKGNVFVVPSSVQEDTRLSLRAQQANLQTQPYEPNIVVTGSTLRTTT